MSSSAELGSLTSTYSRDIVRRWCVFVGASDAQSRQIVGLLDRKQLLRKSVKKGIKKKDTPRGLWFLFRHHSARILGWRDRVPEGHPHGFSAELNNALRFLLWPDVNEDIFLLHLPLFVL